MEQAKALQRDRQSGQMSLFSVAPDIIGSAINDIQYPDIAEWEEREKLLYEKETVGFYITGHPLENALAEIETITDSTIANLGSLNEGQPVRIGGLIRECKQHKSKRGEPMAFVTLEDVVDTVEVMVFPETYATCYRLLSTPDPVIVSGTIQKGERGAKVIAEEIHLIPEALQKYTQSIHANLEADSVNRPRLEELKQLLFNYHGKCPFSLTLHFQEKARWTWKSTKITPFVLVAK